MVLWQAILTVVDLAACIGLLLLNVAPPDAVMAGGLVVLMAAQIVSVQEALEGFSNESLLTVVVLFIVAAGVSETGGLDHIFSKLLGTPTSTVGAQVRVLIPVAIVSAFFNNTPVIAMLVPVLQAWCSKVRQAPGQLFIPLSYASILGGTCTLIGTSTNLVVEGQVKQRYEGSVTLGLFELGKVGVPVALAGLTYIILFSRYLLPRKLVGLEASSDPRDFMVGASVTEHSSCAGKSVEEAGLRGLPGLFLASVQTGPTVVHAVGPDLCVRAGDILYFVGNMEEFPALCQSFGLRPLVDLSVLDTAQLHLSQDTKASLVSEKQSGGLRCNFCGASRGLCVCTPTPATVAARALLRAASASPSAITSPGFISPKNEPQQFTSKFASPPPLTASKSFEYKDDQGQNIRTAKSLDFQQAVGSAFPHFSTDDNTGRNYTLNVSDGRMEDSSPRKNDENEEVVGSSGSFGKFTQLSVWMDPEVLAGRLNQIDNSATHREVEEEEGETDIAPKFAKMVQAVIKPGGVFDGVTVDEAKFQSWDVGASLVSIQRHGQPVNTSLLMVQEHHQGGGGGTGSKGLVELAVEEDGDDEPHHTSSSSPSSPSYPHPSRPSLPDSLTHSSPYQSQEGEGSSGSRPGGPIPQSATLTPKLQHSGARPLHKSTSEMEFRRALGKVILQGGDRLLLAVTAAADSDQTKRTLDSTGGLQDVVMMGGETEVGGPSGVFMIPVHVVAPCSFIGKDAKQHLANLPGMQLVSVERSGSGAVLHWSSVEGVLEVMEGDILTFQGAPESVMHLRKIPGFHLQPDQVGKLAGSKLERRLVQAVLATRSRLVGKTVKDSHFRSHFNAAIVAIHRNGGHVTGKIGEVVLKAGDVLLLDSTSAFVEKHRGAPDFLLVYELEGSAPPRMEKLSLAGACAVGMLALYITGLCELITAALLAAAVMIISGCIDVHTARAAVKWDVYITIACSFGFSAAIEKTGVASTISEWLVSAGLSTGTGEIGVLVAVYLATVLLSNVMANNAAAALMFPIAANTAEMQGMQLKQVIFILMLAASASFASPFGYQTNLMVWNPGNYEFKDFVRFGGPMQVWQMIASMVAVILLDVWWLEWFVGIAVLVGCIIGPAIWGSFKQRYHGGNQRRVRYTSYNNL